MFFKQYYLGCLAHASYMIGDETTGAAAVVDPQRDIDQYLEDAAAHGLAIRHVILTHFHADFIAGHLELRERAGATIHLGPKADAEYAFKSFGERSPLVLGPQVRLEALETPGHTPEGISILVFDEARGGGARPYAVLTGDTLFIGDVGRPDLMASIGITAEELASMLYDSLHGKILELPDKTLVFPAHGAGSMCGKNMSKETSSTLGEQRRFNYALKPMSREQFIKLVTADQPEAPAYFSHDAMLNRRERPTLEATLSRTLKPLALDEVLRLETQGAYVLDVREPNEFAAAHLRGSVNIGLGGKYATWAGSLLDRGRGIVIIAEPGREEEGAVRLGRIGFDQVAGYLEGGMAALAEREDLVAALPRVTAAELVEELAARRPPPIVVDVRGEGERLAGRIEGSLHIPLNHLESRSGELPKDRDLVLHCASGYRSSIGASLLQRQGFTRLRDLVGGFGAWERAGVAGIGAA